PDHVTYAAAAADAPEWPTIGDGTRDGDRARSSPGGLGRLLAGARHAPPGPYVGPVRTRGFHEPHAAQAGGDISRRRDGYHGSGDRARAAAHRRSRAAAVLADAAAAVARPGPPASRRGQRH